MATSGSSIWAPTVNVVDQELRDTLQSIIDPLGGAGYIGFDGDLPYPENTVGAELKELAQEIDNINAENSAGYVTLLEFGAVGDGVTLNDAAFSAALAATDRLYIPNPDVAYLISQPIVITQSNVRIMGESRLLSRIIMNNSSLPLFTIAPNLSNIELESLYLGRQVDAVATASGIECTGVSTGHSFRSLSIENQWNGMLLGETTSGQVVNCNVFRCYGNGVKQVTGGGPNLNWDIRDSRLYENNGHGLEYSAEGTNADVILGSVDNVYSYYNSGNGLRALGTVAKKLNSLRITGGLFSSNGDTGVFLDTYGARHKVANVSANFQGTTTTGRNRAQAGSGAGNGIYLTANNLEVIATGNNCSENSNSGMRVAANLATIMSNCCTDNGKNAAVTAEQRSGLRLATGRIIAQGNICTNRVAGVGTQQVGIHLTDGVNCIIASNSCAGNVANSIVTAGASSTNRILHNAGYNPLAMDTVVPSGSPWTYTAGPTLEVLYLKGGTIQSIVVDGQTLATAAVAATLFHAIDLDPNQSVVVTYTAIPTVIRKRR